MLGGESMVDMATSGQEAVEGREGDGVVGCV